MISALDLKTLLKGATLALAGIAATACSNNGASSQEGGNTQVTQDGEAALAIRTAQREMADGNLAEAGRLLDEAREIEPENSSLWVAIARLRFRGGEHLTAIEAADYALELGPQYAPALLMRGQLVRDSNGLSESLPWFEAAVRADPDNAEVIGEYAATLGDVGRHGDMLDVLTELSNLDRGYPQAHYLRAVLAARAGEPVLARSLLERSGWRNSNIPAAMLVDAVIDLEQGNTDTALETLADLRQRQPANRRVRDLYARALWEAGRDEQLIAEMTPVIEGSDASAYITMLVGRSHERQGDRAKAGPLIADAYEQRDAALVQLSSNNASGGFLAPQTRETRRSIVAGSLTRAAEQVEQLKQQFPQSADVLVLAGDAHLANGNANSALENYTKSAQVRRPWPLTRKLISASLRAGEDQAAKDLASRYALSNPRDADAIIAVMLQAKASKQWDRVSELTDYLLELGVGHDPVVLGSRMEAAQARDGERETDHDEALLVTLQPPKLVRD